MLIHSKTVLRYFEKYISYIHFSCSFQSLELVVTWRILIDTPQIDICIPNKKMYKHNYNTINVLTSKLLLFVQKKNVYKIIA